MKKIITPLACVLFSSFAFGQSEQAYNKAAALPMANESTQNLGKEVTITLKNSAEKPLPVFAGPKEEIRNPKIKPVGGMSTNKLYIHENDVVCIMTEESTPKACAIVKPGMTTMEINTSGTTISGK